MPRPPGAKELAGTNENRAAARHRSKPRKLNIARPFSDIQTNITLMHDAASSGRNPPPLATSPHDTSFHPHRFRRLRGIWPGQSAPAGADRGAGFDPRCGRRHEYELSPCLAVAPSGGDTVGAAGHT